MSLLIYGLQLIQTNFHKGSSNQEQPTRIFSDKERPHLDLKV